MKRKLLALILVFISVSVFSSCSYGNNESNNSEELQSDVESVSVEKPEENAFANQIKVIGPNNENIEAIVNSHDDQTFFVQSANWLCEYDMFTAELINEFNLTEAIKQKVAQTGGNVVKNSFEQLRVSAFSAKSGKYFIVTDSNGNMFKLVRNAQGKLEVSDDYYLIEYYEGEKYSPKVSKGLDFMAGTDRMFSLILENNFFYVEEYNMANLSNGVLKRKFLWDGLDAGDGYKKLEPVKFNVGVWAFYVHNDYLILVKAGGGVIRLSADLVDTNFGGEEIDFFAEAKIAAESATKVELDWCRDYDPSVMSMYVKEEYLDKTYYASYSSGESIISGMVFSKKNETLYYTNASDGYLYEVKMADLANTESGSFISDVSKQIANVHCGKGQTFYSFGNGLGYNEFANSLYLTFNDKTNVQIVDLNDKNNYQVIGDYIATYDMFSMIGNKDNTVVHVLHLVSEMKHDVEYRYLYVSTFNLKQ